MQVKYVFIISVFGISNTIHGLPTPKFFESTSEFIFNFFYESYGNQDASSEVQSYVRALCKKSGLVKTEKIRIKRLSTIGKRAIGERSVVIAGICGLPHVFFISEEWFQSLSNEQKQFLIMQKIYEFAHYKNEVNLLLNGVIPICLDCYEVFDVGGTGWHNAIQNKSRWCAYGIKCGISSLLFSLLYALNARVLRYFTLHADVQTANKLGTSDGGIAWCQAMDAADQAEENELVQTPFFTWKRNLITNFLDINPSWQERIEQLKTVRAR